MEPLLPQPIPDRLLELVTEIHRARNGWIECRVAELHDRNVAIETELAEGASVSAADRVATMVSEAASIDEMRARAKLENLLDEQRTLIAILNSAPQSS